MAAYWLILIQAKIFLRSEVGGICFSLKPCPESYSGNADYDLGNSLKPSWYIAEGGGLLTAKKKSI